MRAIMLAATLLCVAPALAHENDAFADWMKSLKQPDRPTVSCCGPADQVYVDSYEPTDDEGFIAYVNGREVKIPPQKVIWNRVNPTGVGVLFWSHHDEDGYIVYCFVPSAGT